MTYSKPCQISKMDEFAAKARSLMFGRVLNIPLACIKMPNIDLILFDSVRTIFVVNIFC